MAQRWQWRRRNRTGVSHHLMRTGRAAAQAAAGRLPGKLPATQPLSPALKSLYGIGAVAFGVENLALGTLLILFFNQVVGLPAPWVGAAIWLGRLRNMTQKIDPLHQLHGKEPMVAVGIEPKSM